MILMQQSYFTGTQFLKRNYKIAVFFTCIFSLSLPAAFAQSSHFYKTTETLKKEKEKAISSGNESKGNEIAKEIELRNAEQKEIELLNVDLNKKIEIEDYLEAETIKQKINDLKAKQVKTDELRKKLEASIASEDYETAEKYKTELLQIKPRTENINQTAQKTETIVNTNENYKQQESVKQNTDQLTQEAERVKQETERLKQEAARVQRETERLKQEELSRVEAQKQKAAAEKMESERLEKLRVEEEARKIAEQKALEFSLYGFTVSDNFSDNSNNWNEESFYDRRAQIVSGKMVLEASNERSSYRVNHGFPVNLEKDFSVEASTRWIRGEDKNGYGIDFVSDYEGNRYYSFQVAAIGYYSILYYQNNQWSDIVPWKSSSAVKRGNEPNLLKIKKEGNDLFFYANNTLLTTIPWKGGFGKDFGFRIFDKQVVEFDDFTIKGIKE